MVILPGEKPGESTPPDIETFAGLMAPLPARMPPVKFMGTLSVMLPPLRSVAPEVCVNVPLVNPRLPLLTLMVPKFEIAVPMLPPATLIVAPARLITEDPGLVRIEAPLRKRLELLSNVTPPES